MLFTSEQFEENCFNLLGLFSPWNSDSWVLLVHGFLLAATVRPVAAVAGQRRWCTLYVSSVGTRWKLKTLSEPANFSFGLYDQIKWLNYIHCWWHTASARTSRRNVRSTRACHMLGDQTNFAPFWALFAFGSLATRFQLCFVIREFLRGTAASGVCGSDVEHIRIMWRAHRLRWMCHFKAN